MNCVLRRLMLAFALLMTGLPLMAQTDSGAADRDPATAAVGKQEYVLGPGDVVRFVVFQNPDLSIEARIGESGFITYPLIGNVRIGGLTGSQAETLVSRRLRDGKFLQNPSISLSITQFRSQQVSVLGNVNRPGRYPLETTGTHLTEVLALAGGIAPGGSDIVMVSTQRGGKRTKYEVDLPAMFLTGDFRADLNLQAGDVVYVHRAQIFYVHGQVQRPGSFPLERNMSVAQAIAKSGGITLRGREKGIRVTRLSASGSAEVLELKMDDLIRADDVVFVPESLF